MNFETPIESIYGIGPKIMNLLGKMNIETVGDLISHYPFRYDDFSKITPIQNVTPADNIAVRGKILAIKNERSFRQRINITQAIVEDETGSLKVVWFNQPYLIQNLPKGTPVILAGKAEYQKNILTLISPEYEKDTAVNIHTARIVPIYPETQGLSSKMLRNIMQKIFQNLEFDKDFLPQNLVDKENLMDFKTAIRQIHFPDSLENIKNARERIAFEELFLLQLKLLKIKKEWQKNTAPILKINIAKIKKMIGKLPYKLTNAQRKVAWEILKDLSGQTHNIKSKQKPILIPPMNRLLEGDVGSGKTIVAGIALLVTAENHFQSALIAPTEILAIQHFESLTKILKHFDIKIALITGAQSQFSCKGKVEKSAKSDIQQKIQDGEVDVIIGTHAVLQEKIEFKKLGLAIIDEQHRFGVKQRAFLRKMAYLKQKLMPHFLSMTATPIPRTLSLAVFGDLDLSIIDEMPAGRQKIKTYLVPPEKRQGAYKFIESQIKLGKQVFVICPLIEESDKLGVRAATSEFNKLTKEIFPQYKIGLLHGKLSAKRGSANSGKSKEQVMMEFKEGKFDILVSTAVVEVGVDVPNATVMMIEGAERFGLAQLHQFRGRVGRGSHQSFCLLFCDNLTAKIKNRLNTFVKLDDGFALAEKDLKFRGPGELVGLRQHGIADLKMASLTDSKMILRTRNAAVEIVNEIDKYPALIEKLTNQNKIVE
jgi:ATP-dependent DNA helicase RecG